jgi:hypothetical protein
MLTLKVENSLIFLVGTGITTVSMMEWQFILPLKTFIRNNNYTVHLFTCLTTARYGQLQPSTKTTVQDYIKKTDENIIKCTM